MRKKVMAFNAKVEAWLMKKLRGVWLEPIFLAIFIVMAVGSLAGGLHLQKDTLYYSALIWAIAALMCWRRIQRIRRREKEEKKTNDRTEEKTR